MLRSVLAPLIAQFAIILCLRESRRQRMLFDLTTSTSSATSSRPAASRMGPSARIWRSPPPAPASATWRSRSARRSCLRRRQGVTPTPAGRTLLQHARTLLAQAERLREDIARPRGGLAGQVRLLSNTNALTEFLPEALSAFLSAHPQVSVDLEERLSRRDRRPRRRGRGDIGIVAGTVDTGQLEPIPFRSDRFVLVVARGHPLAARPAVAFADVLDHDFVGLDRASALQRFLAGKATRIGRPIRLRVQLRSFEGVCRMVEATSASASCPKPRPGARRRPWRSPSSPSPTPGRTAALTICVRDARGPAAGGAAACGALAG